MTALQTNPVVRPTMNRTATVQSPKAKLPIEKVVIGYATLYRADCFDILPQLADIDAVITDPPYGIGFTYRSYDDAPGKYEDMMQRLVPQLIRVTNNGPCFVWQSQLKADRWHRYFPAGFRIIAACKQYRHEPSKRVCLSWDPVIFWSGRSRIHDEVFRDWHLADLTVWDGYTGDNPVPCPRPLTQVRYFCNNVRANTILDPFMGSGTTGVAALQCGKRFVGSTHTRNTPGLARSAAQPRHLDQHRCNGKISEIFEDVCRGNKTRRKIAVIATARRLLVICWAMLRDGTTWREPGHPIGALPTS